MICKELPMSESKSGNHLPVWRSSVMVIWMLTFIVGLGNFAHCIATSCEVLVAVLAHRAPWIAYPALLPPELLRRVSAGGLLRYRPERR
jgi:hypothetical protein